jgi:hypothetical protein
MTEFRISGVWKNSDDVITHYAFHTVYKDGVGKAKKLAKAQAISILEIRGNTATTWMWNYKSSFWTIGENVTVVGSGNDKYLRSNPDDKTANNLEHLIDYDWISAQ